MTQQRRQNQAGNGRGNAPRSGNRQVATDQRPATANEQISADESAQARMKKLFELIRQRRDEIEAVLPSDVPYQKFEAVMNMAIRREPKLLECYGPSVIRAAIQSAYDGLMPDGKEAVILYSDNKVPGSNPTIYRLEARYQSMVYGLRKKLVQAGAVTFIDAKNVYAKERFVHEEGLNPKLEHTPILDPVLRGDRIASYSIARLPDGEKVFDVLSKADVMAARDVAKTKNVWDGAFGGEMWKKTAIRRLSKAIPTTVPIRDAEAAEMFPQFAGANTGLSLPAPPRPSRADFARLEHQAEVPLDLGAFEGGYEDRETQYVENDRGDPREQQQQSQAKPVESTDAQKADTAKKSDTDKGEAAANPAAADDTKAMANVTPKSAEEWQYWGGHVSAIIGQLSDEDSVNEHWEDARELLDKAPKDIRDRVNQEFRDRLTDIASDDQPASSQGSLSIAGGDNN